MQQLGLLDKIPSSAWSKKWVVDVEPVGNGQAVLKYLAPYVYRVAISDKRILDCTPNGVTYSVETVEVESLAKAHGARP
jgi:hypothetical protein